MTLTLNWQAVAVLVTLFLAWNGFFFVIIRWLVSRMIASMETRINDATNGLKEHREEYLRFLGKLPLDYYRREDMIRFETITHAKLDALAGDIKLLECRKCPTSTVQ
jgi:hypothetical protein